MTAWEPTQNRVLLKVDPKKTHTESGLTLPENPTNFDTGVIIKVGQIPPFERGNGFNEKPHFEIKPGRRAVFHKEAGYPILIKEDEDLHVVLNVNDIYFVSDNPEADLRAY